MKLVETFHSQIFADKNAQNVMYVIIIICSFTCYFLSQCLTVIKNTYEERIIKLEHKIDDLEEEIDDLTP